MSEEVIGMTDAVTEVRNTEDGASLESSLTVFRSFVTKVEEITGLASWTLFRKRHDQYCVETDTWTTGRYGVERWSVHTTDELAALSEEIYWSNHASASPSEYFIGIPRGAAAPPLWCLDLDADHGCSPEEELARMMDDSFVPLAVVATSPQNRQVWLPISGYGSEELSRNNYSRWRSVQDTLISRYCGDTGSKGPSHLFRLPFPGLRNLKTVVSGGLVRYKYDSNFRTSARIYESASPDRSVIESWMAMERDAGFALRVAPCRPGRRVDSHRNCQTGTDSGIPESVWDSWTAKRERLIRDDKYLRSDGTIDDSRVDIALMQRTILWYLRNDKDKDSMCKAMTHLILCCERQVETDPERWNKKGNSKDYAMRTLGKAHTYILQQLNDRGDLAAAERLSEAYMAL